MRNNTLVIQEYTLVIRNNTLVMQAYTLVIYVYTLVMQAYTLVMHDYTLAMHDYTLAMHNYTLAMHNYTLAMHNYTLAMHNYTFAMHHYILRVENYPLPMQVSPREDNIFSTGTLFTAIFITLQLSPTMLSLSIRPVIAARGIEKPHAFLVNAGFSPRNADHLLNGAVSLKLQHLEELCIVLKCEPNDLLVWSPDKNTSYTKDLPLVKLQQRTPPSLIHMLSSLPYDQLKTMLSEVQKKV